MITSAVCISYKKEIIKGLHSEGHRYKLALFSGFTELNKYTESYLLTTGEVSGAGYITGGKNLTGFSVKTDGDSAVLDFDDVEFNNVTFNAAGALIYNDSLEDKNAVAVFSFGANFPVVNATFRVIMPDPVRGSALVSIL